MTKQRMAASGLLAVLLLLSIVLLALSACGSGNSPEGVVRASMDAVNARDKAKFVSLWSPDKRDYFAAPIYDYFVQSKQRFLEVKTIVVRDSLWIPKGKEVTVQVKEESSAWGTATQLDATHVFLLEQLNGRWYISSGY